jgi:hypothetical protein
MAPNLFLSAAVSLKPFLDPDGNPMSDVSEFAKVLDFVGSFYLVLSVSPFSDSVTQKL